MGVTTSFFPVRNAGGEAGSVRGAAEDAAGRFGAVHQESSLPGQDRSPKPLQCSVIRFSVLSAALFLQASESGSADDTQSQVLEWQEMVAEAVSARDRAREEKATMVLRISHMEEEREGETVAAG